MANKFSVFDRRRYGWAATPRECIPNHPRNNRDIQRVSVRDFDLFPKALSRERDVSLHRARVSEHPRKGRSWSDCNSSSPLACLENLPQDFWREFLDRCNRCSEFLNTPQFRCAPFQAILLCLQEFGLKKIDIVASKLASLNSRGGCGLSELGHHFLMTHSRNCSCHSVEASSEVSLL